MTDAYFRYVQLASLLGAIRAEGKPVVVEERLLDAMDVAWEALTPTERDGTRYETWRAPVRPQ